MRADVVIIGAGPAGLAAAIHLKQLGVGRIVLLDRHDFPRDKTCGSAVSPKGIEMLAALGVREEVAAAAYEIRGLRLVTPKGHDVSMMGHTGAALICCRRTLDNILLQRALALGVEFLPDFQVGYLLHRSDRVAGCREAHGREGYGREVVAGCTIVADGAHSRFTIARGRPRLVQAIMGWWDGVAFEPHRLEMLFDSLVSPYYGWLFPEGPTRVNIGICYEDTLLSRNARTLFQEFLDKHFSHRLAGAVQVGGFKGHPISISTRIDRLTSPGRIVVGEAGRMTHYATGEGIYQGLASGILAAEAIRSMGDTSEAAAFMQYERECRRRFALSFRAGRLWQHATRAGALDLAARAALTPSVQRMLARTMAHM